MTQPSPAIEVIRADAVQVGDTLYLGRVERRVAGVAVLGQWVYLEIGEPTPRAFLCTWEVRVARCPSGQLALF